VEYQPELGQVCYGTPWGRYEVPEFVTALVLYIKDEIRRVYWNNQQEEWNERDDPGIRHIEWHGYWWGDEKAPEAGRPNLSAFDVKIYWYKHPGRGMSCNVYWTPNEWAKWFELVMAAIDVMDKGDDQASKQPGQP
jgi:hypothetical protein